MRLVLLHGPGKSVSREKLLTIKKGFDENSVVSFEGNFDAVQFWGSLKSGSLFETGPRLVVAENPSEGFFEKGAKISGDDSLTLAIWVEKELGVKSNLLDFVKSNSGEVMLFSEAKEVSVFPFLDAMALGEKGAFVEMQKLLKLGYDFQYLLTMAFYLLRSLAVTPKRAPDFVRNKLERQRRNFPGDRIAMVYKELLEMDFKVKSGLLERSEACFGLVTSFVKLT